LIGPGQYVLSAEFKINLLRSAKGTRLACVAKVLKAGATLTVVESEVFCESAGESRLVSKATVTLAVVRPRGGK
jgi:acyl-coenzyme A thioesterase PaaI-like protein